MITTGGEKSEGGRGRLEFMRQDNTGSTGIVGEVPGAELVAGLVGVSDVQLTKVLFAVESEERC